MHETHTDARKMLLLTFLQVLDGVDAVFLSDGDKTILRETVLKLFKEAESKFEL